MRRKTDKEFKKEVFDLVGDEYVFLERYVNSQTKIEVRHNKCGNTYKVVPNNFIKGSRCPYCAGLAKKTDTQFKREVYNLVGNEYSFLESYINIETSLEVKHNKCGHTYKVTPANFLKGTRCPYCYGCRKKTDTQFQQEVFDLVGNKYVFLDTYVNTHTKLKVKHNKCGNVYEVMPSNFLRGQRCPYCSASFNFKKTDAQFKQEVFDLVKDAYTFLDSYVSDHTKIRVKHNECGHIYKVTPGNFLYGYRCPYCSSSKGEDVISKILKSLGIKYEYQKTFDDLTDKASLSYDFFIPNQNILIEYQGKQHYEPIDYFGGESQFKSQQKHDSMKLDYAKLHNYNLIAVPYTEDTFSKIKKYLIKHGLEA